MKDWLPYLKILVILWLISSLAALLFTPSVSTGGDGNVAVIPIKGMISVESSSGFGSQLQGSDAIIRQLEQASSDPSITVIMLDINSPGGSGVAAQEIGQMVKSIDKPTVAVIREIGTSAAYWIASSSDHVIANRMSLTGSIGVIGSYLDFSGLLEENNITYQRFVSGELKDMNSPLKEPSARAEYVWQAIINEMEQEFIVEVANNRNMTLEEVEDLATGQVYTAKQAMSNGLIDQIGSKMDAVEFIEQNYNLTADLVEYTASPGLMELLSSFTINIYPQMGNYLNSQGTIRV